MAISRYQNTEKPDKVKIFVLDIDGTLCNIDSVFFKTAYALSYFGSELDESFLDKREYITLSDCGILSLEDEMRILTLFDVFKVWEQLEPFPGVLEFLQKISNHSHRIIYLTSRRSELRKQTTNWLFNNKFPRPSDAEFGNETPTGKVTLMMNGPKTKNEHLADIFSTFSNEKIYYFENDIFHLKEASNIGFKNIFSFDESHVISNDPPSNVKILRKPKYNAYSGLDEAIFT